MFVAEIDTMDLPSFAPVDFSPPIIALSVIPLVELEPSCCVAPYDSTDVGAQVYCRLLDSDSCFARCSNKRKNFWFLPVEAGLGSWKLDAGFTVEEPLCGTIDKVSSDLFGVIKFHASLVERRSTSRPRPLMGSTQLVARGGASADIIVLVGKEGHDSEEARLRKLFFMLWQRRWFVCI